MKNLFLKLLSLKSQKGQSLIELLITIGLAAILLPAFLIGFAATRVGGVQQSQQIQALAYMREAEEAVRIVRSNNWTTFATDGTFHPIQSGSTWVLQNGSDTPTSNITRQITVSDVYRDNNGNIVANGGTLDPSSKKVVILVSWTQPYSSSIQSTTYLTRYQDNVTFTNTTLSDFNGSGNNLSIKQGTSVTSNGGGDVELSQGNANWCTPQNSIEATYTLPRQGNSIASTPGATQGSSNTVYIGMGNGTNGVSYQTFSVSAPPDPANPSFSAIGNGYTSSNSTNAVYNDGTYSYLATNGSSSQVIILNSSYTKVGSINLPSNTNAYGIFVTSHVAYITSGNKVYTYNVTNPASPTALGSGTIWDNSAIALQVVVQSGKAYVSMSGSITGLEIFTISNGGATLTPWSVASVNWFQTPKGLAVNSTGTRAYIAFAANGNIQGGFFIVDTSTRWLGFFNPNKATYNTNWDGNGTTNPLGMALATANKALIVGTGGSQQYQVVDITNDNPTHCGGLSISQGISGVTSLIQQDGRVYSYIISGEANNQLKAIEGGTGGLYTNTGTFESPIFDAGSTVSFNRFSATITQPSQTSIQLQVAVAPTVNGSCSTTTFYYVGPDGSSSTYFTPNGNIISGTIPFGIYNQYQNPNSCFRYKAYLSTNDTSQTPVLNDITINYSP